MLRIDIGLKAIKFYSFPPPPQPLPTPHFFGFPPPPPHFYSFPPPPTTFPLFFSTTTTTFLLFSSSTTTTTTTFTIFFSMTVNKRMQTTIISSVCRSVSSFQEQSWFSSTLSSLSSSLATVPLTESQFTTTTCISSSLTQYT